jgi:hypothetical protein
MVETAVTSEVINLACWQAFDMILAAFKDKFLASGLTETQSNELTLYVTTVVEGDHDEPDISPCRATPAGSQAPQTIS